MTLFLLLWVLMVLLTEWRFPAEPPPLGNNTRRMRNFALGGLALVISPLLLWLVGRVIGSVPPLVVMPVVVQLLVLDLWAYALHRAYHRVPMLWRFHAPHHLDEHLDATSAFRFHGGEIIISALLRLVPALMVGIDVITLLFFESLLLAAAVFHHSNIALPPWFDHIVSKVIVTPSIHRVHHHNIRVDTDANYAAILSIWDHIFGTVSPNRHMPTMGMGVEGEGERDFVGLMKYPFVRR